jgi:peptidyl-prolyl cis-trans isomerase C
MTKRYLSLPVIGFLAAMAMPVAAQDADTVVATVDGVDITVGHMIVARATLPEQFQQLPPEVLFDGILTQLIQQTLLSQSFEGDLPKRSALSLENERRSLTAGEAIEALLQDALTEDALQAAYDEAFKDAQAGEEYNASHILVPTEEEALAVIATLEGGAEFAATAREKSTGPSGPGGGSLGWFGTGAMVPSFEAAVIALEVGEVSAPVETQFGWHVIRLNETRVAELPTLDSQRAELAANLRDIAVTAQIEALEAAASVDRKALDGIDPAILQDMSLVD